MVPSIAGDVDELGQGWSWSLLLSPPPTEPTATGMTRGVVVSSILIHIDDFILLVSASVVMQLVTPRHLEQL